MTDLRVRTLQIAAGLLLVGLAAQLIRIQLIDPPVLAPGSNGERVRSLDVEPPRGLIVDRNGVVVAHNVPEYSLAIVPGELPEDEGERREALLEVERQIAVPYGEIERALTEGLALIDPFAPVTLRGGFDREAAISLRAALADVPGVHVRTQPVRVYDGGDLLPHILGYVGPLTPDEVDDYLDRGYPLDANVGRAGVELVYEPQLRGEPGERLIMADPAGRELRELGEEPAQPGADLVLSIDLRLQRAAAKALADGIDRGIDFALSVPVQRSEPLERTGAAVVMDVHTGELLAFVTYPSYDANVFSGEHDDAAIEALLTDDAHPLVHRGFMEVESPGSIFKPLVGAGALEEGIATPSTQITSTGAISVPSIYDPSVVYTFRDWAAHGTLDFYGGIARSSDVYFYYLAGGYARGGVQIFEGLGADRVAEYARSFGLGSPTGLDLPGEVGGLVPDTAWKEETVGEPWVLGDTYTFGIGQGYLAVTPIQMAVAAAALANGGDVLVPRVVHGFRTDEETTTLEPQVASTVPVDPENLAVVREAMRRAANPGGTALTGEPPGIEIAGKTGTAEFGPPLPNGQFDSHGWYLGFAPYDDPEIAVVVYLNHGVGSTHAGPVAKQILEAYFDLEQQGYTVGRALP